MSDLKLEARHRGAKDYKAGKTLDDNPCHVEENRQAWRDGWLKASRQDQRHIEAYEGQKADLQTANFCLTNEK